VAYWRLPPCTRAFRIREKNSGLPKRIVISFECLEKGTVQEKATTLNQTQKKEEELLCGKKRKSDKPLEGGKSSSTHRGKIVKISIQRRSQPSEGRRSRKDLRREEAVGAGDNGKFPKNCSKF